MQGALFVENLRTAGLCYPRDSRERQSSCYCCQSITKCHLPVTNSVRQSPTALGQPSQIDAGYSSLLSGNRHQLSPVYQHMTAQPLAAHSQPTSCSHGLPEGVILVIGDSLRMGDSMAIGDFPTGASNFPTVNAQRKSTSTCNEQKKQAQAQTDIQAIAQSTSTQAQAHSAIEAQSTAQIPEPKAKHGERQHNTAALVEPL